MISRLSHNLFYHRYGLFRVSHFVQPKLTPSSELELPFSSIYHHCSWDGIGLGPMADDPIFKGINRAVYIKNVHELKTYEGGPRRVTANIPNLERELRGKNRRLRPLRDLSSLAQDQQSLVVYNYDMIPHVYRYVRTVYTSYNKWYNIFNCIVDGMVEATQISSHHQFFKIGIPKILPSLQQLNIAAESKEIKQSILKIFNEVNSFILLDLWKWLSEDRNSSILSKIPRDKLHLINFLLQEGDRWTVLNLGFLDTVRDDSSLSEEQRSQVQTDPTVESTSRLPPAQLQKRVLILLMNILELRTVTANLSAKQQDELDSTGAVSDDSSHIDDGVIASTKKDAINTADAERIIIDQRNILDDEIDEESANIEQQQIDEKLEQLNAISSSIEVEEDSVTVDDIINKPILELDEEFKRHLDHYSESGTLSASEYSRFNKLSKTYQTIQSPVKGKSLGEYINVKSEDLKVDAQTPAFTDSDSILDKTMLQSTLQTFDKVYQTKALKQHTIAMALSIQRAGVAVTGYEVETEESVLGKYDLHIVRLAPIQGAPSTITFRVPKLEDDGSFIANNSKYVLRKMFSDVPIRKIGPDEVALTSYYGKLFIKRGIRKSRNLTTWLHDQVVAKYFSESPAPLVDMKPANVFDNTVRLPRHYSALSQSFQELSTKDYKFLFDRKQVLETLTEEVLTVEKDHPGMIIAAVGANSVVLMDVHGNLYSADPKDRQSEPKSLGSILNYLGLEEAQAPVESTHLSIFGQEIPLGVVLAYLMGFSQLLSALKVDVRRVEAGTRVNIDELTEYAITFSDETLVFPKDNKLASLILAGFNDYWKSLKLYSVYSFDQRAVYLNVLENSGLGVRYLRELELVDQMFVDPITLLRLEKMKMPKTLRGLLIKSAQMLLVDEHPDEMDLNYMNIKGNEVIAGAVYSELIQSLRTHNAQLGKSNKKIEMNPHAVWIRIVDDPIKVQKAEINPIMELKEKEAVTFSGTGGRNRRSMTKDTRIMHPSHQGVISEATVDSSDAGINVYLSPNAKFVDALGQISTFDYKKDGMTSMLSTSALVSPASVNDDRIE